MAQRVFFPDNEPDPISVDRPIKAPQPGELGSPRPKTRNPNYYEASPTPEYADHGLDSGNQEIYSFEDSSDDDGGGDTGNILDFSQEEDSILTRERELAEIGRKLLLNGLMAS
jgi:hypothetical protein